MKFIRYAAIPALLAAPAFAGNLSEPVVEPIISAPVQVQPVSDWSGFYLGGQAGYGDASDDRESDLSGGLGGVHAGYLYDLGQWVIGAELDYDWANLTGDSRISNTFGDSEIDAIKRLKFIGGYDLGDGLFYGTVGGFQVDFSTVTWPDVKEEGWLVGVGYKHKITENWIGGVEFLHHRDSDFARTGNRIDLNTLTARVSYKF